MHNPFPLRHQQPRKPEPPVRSSVSLKPTAPVRDRVVADRAAPLTRTDSPDRAGRKKVLGLVQIDFAFVRKLLSVGDCSIYFSFRSLISFTMCAVSTPITTPAYSILTTSSAPQAKGPCARSGGPARTTPTQTERQCRSRRRGPRSMLMVYKLFVSCTVCL